MTIEAVISAIEWRAANGMNFATNDPIFLNLDEMTLTLVPSRRIELLFGP
jgi:hypothetical protein